MDFNTRCVASSNGRCPLHRADQGRAHRRLVHPDRGNLEVNGAGAESTHIWDRRTGLLQAWRDLMRQYRWLYEIGAANRACGFKPMGWRDFVRDYRREKALTPQYPLTG